MRRILTEDEEQVIRLVHHDFNGISMKQAAEIMDTNIDRINNILQSVYKKAPQLFPILSPDMQMMWNLWKAGKNKEEILLLAKLVGIPDVRRKLHFLRKHGFISGPVNIVRYNPVIHVDIKEKF